MVATQIFNKITRKKQNGFMLPSVIIISMAAMIVAIALSAVVVQNGHLVTYNTFAQVAQTAAKSGVDFAKEEFVTTGSYSGTSETTIVLNDRYRATFTVQVLSTSTDGLSKLVESTGKVYLPEIGENQYLQRTVRTDIIKTTGTTLTPDQLSPMAWYDASEPFYDSEDPIVGQITDKQYIINERETDGVQHPGSSSSIWIGLDYNKQLRSSVYSGALFNLAGLPKDSTIDSATLQFWSYNSADTSSTLEIEALADGETPVGGIFAPYPAENQLRGKLTVGSPVTWEVGDWPKANQLVTAPDLKDLVQAALAQPGFDPDSEPFGVRIKKVGGYGYHRVKRVEASLTVRYHLAEPTLIADGQNIDAWRDISGNGHDLYEAAANSTPILRANSQNGYSMVEFENGDAMVNSVFDLSELARGATIFAVTKGDSGSDSNAISVRMTSAISESNCIGTSACTKRAYELSRSDSSQYGKAAIERSHSSAASSLSATSEDSDYAFIPGATSAAMQTLGIAYSDNGYYPSAELSSLDYAFNGNVYVNCPTSGTYPKTFQSDIQILVGQDENGARQYIGNIGEIVIYNRILTCRETQSIQKYLREKWFNDTTEANVVACPTISPPAF